MAFSSRIPAVKPSVDSRLNALQNGEAAERQSKEASSSGNGTATAPAGQVTVTYWYRCAGTAVTDQNSCHAAARLACSRRRY